MCSTHNAFASGIYLILTTGRRQTKPDTDGADVKKISHFFNMETRPRGLQWGVEGHMAGGEGGGPGQGPFRHSVAFICLRLVCRS